MAVQPGLVGVAIPPGGHPDYLDEGFAEYFASEDTPLAEATGPLWEPFDISDLVGDKDLDYRKALQLTTAILEVPGLEAYKGHFRGESYEGVGFASLMPCPIEECDNATHYQETHDSQATWSADRTGRYELVIQSLGDLAPGEVLMQSQ